MVISKVLALTLIGRVSYHSKMFRNASAIALFALVLLTVPVRAEEFSQHFVAVNPPQPLPAFVFEDSKGQTLRLADFRGHAVLLNLWATWCGPCIEEMPALDKLQALVGADKLTIIALDQERNASVGVTAAFFKRHGVQNLQIFNDPSGRISSLLHVSVLPMSILIDSDGHEIGTVEGSVNWAEPDAVKFIEHQLAKTSNDFANHGI